MIQRKVSCRLYAYTREHTYIHTHTRTLQLMYGTIPNIRGKGFNAKLVADFLVQLRMEMGIEDETNTAPEIDEVRCLYMIHTHTCIFLYVYMYIVQTMNIYSRMYACICICIYICIYIYIYIYMKSYVYIHTHSH